MKDLKSSSEETLQLHNLAMFLPQSTDDTTDNENLSVEVICIRYWKLAGFNVSSLMHIYLKGELVSWRAKWEIEKKCTEGYAKKSVRRVYEML